MVFFLDRDRSLLSQDGYEQKGHLYVCVVVLMVALDVVHCRPKFAHSYASFIFPPSHIYVNGGKFGPNYLTTLLILSFAQNEIVIIFYVKLNLNDI